MVYQTGFLFDFIPSTVFYWFVFCGTLCSYNFHWYLTPSAFGSSKKVHWSVAHKKLHLILFILAAIGAAYTGFLLMEHWVWLLITAFITFLYSAPKVNHPLFIFLRKVAVGKTIFLAFMWTHITAILPLLVNGLHWHTQHYLYIINRFFFLYPICILFDYRDRHEDKQAGIKSLITFFSEKGIDRLFWFSLGISFASLLWLWQIAFHWPIFILLLIPLIVLACLHHYAKKNFSDYLYYFVLDGLMMLTGLLLLFLDYLFTFVHL
jgi:4-hydroxybenzoate polyprenyltransferase